MTTAQILKSREWHRADLAWMLLVWAASAALTWNLMRVGWVPSDEGTLATSALRVLNGQWPHSDFAEVYTGGLDFLHAFAMRMFGVQLMALRWMVFAWFVVWVPSVFSLARRFATPAWAAAITLTAVLWTYPNYVAAMPSWYNLFFATWGLAALLRFLDGRRHRWLMIAGVCGGCSLLVKITGIYMIAATLLVLLFCGQQQVGGEQARQRSVFFSSLVSAGCLFFLVMLTHVAGRNALLGEVWAFLLPSYACVGMLLWREWQYRGVGSAARFRSLTFTVGAFATGIALPLFIFLWHYGFRHEVRTLLRGVAGSANVRVTVLGGRMHAPGAAEISSFGFPMLLLFVLAGCATLAQRRSVWVPLAVALGLLLATFHFLPQDVQQSLWLMGGTLTPGIVVFGCMRILCASPSEEAPPHLAALICFAALCSLVQFPLPYVTYFAYTAPFTLLAASAMVRCASGRGNSPLRGVLLLFFLGLGAVGMVGMHHFAPDLRIQRAQSLALTRAGGIRADDTTPMYPEIVVFLREHSPNGAMYCRSDCPELYFLSGLRNPTRDDTGGPVEDAFAAVRSGAVQEFVLNDDAFFGADAASPALRANVQAYLPHATKIGHFTVYTR